MLAKLLLLFFGIFLCLRSVVESYETVDCLDGRSVIPIANNSYTIVQSPSFPKNYSSSCKLQFRTDDAKVSMWFVMLNGAVSQINFDDNGAIPIPNPVVNYRSNYDIVMHSSYLQNFTLYINATPTICANCFTPWTAFQAVIVTFPFKQDSQDCPLMSQTFDFSANPNQVIPISPIFGTAGYQLDFKKCSWFFTINSSQKLKIAARQIILLQNSTLILGDGTNVIKNFNITDDSQTFYFSGSNFNLAYHYGLNNKTNLGFFLFVSAVSQTTTETNVGCNPPLINATAQTTVFSNIDYENGYLSNQHCVSSVVIPPNHEGNFLVTKYSYEEISDKLVLNFAPNNSYPVTWRKDAKLPYEYTLTSDIKSGQLDFRSDGNTQGAGFQARLSTYECKCGDSNFVMSCDEFSTFGPLKDLNWYCSNMDCNYTILQNQKCNNTYFSFLVDNFIRPSIDYIVIMANGIPFENVTSATQSKYFYFSPKASVQIVFHSGPSAFPFSTETKVWSTSIQPFQPPVFVKKMLTNSNATYVPWLPEMGKNDALQVCTNTGTLEMFISAAASYKGLSSYFLYDSDDLVNFVGSLDMLYIHTLNGISGGRKSISGCFTIYSTNSTTSDKSVSALFRIVEETTKNCNNANNVFQMIPSIFSDFGRKVSADATSSGPCTMMIIGAIDSFRRYPSVWISNFMLSSNSTYSFSSTVNGKPLMELSSSDADQWQNVGIYTQVLSITIPSSASISVQLSSSSQSNIPVDLNRGQQRGILSSPSYSGFKGAFPLTELYRTDGYTIFNATFTAKNIYGNANPILSTSQGNISLTQNVTVSTSTGFSLNYEEKSGNLGDGFLIEYNFERPSTDNKPPNSGIFFNPEITLLFVSVFCFFLML